MIVKFEISIINERKGQKRKSCNYISSMVNFHIMDKAKKTFFIILGLGFVLGIVFFIIGSLKPKLGGIYLETTPPSSVWIDGKQVGRTPFRQTMKPSDIIIRLIPDSFEAPLSPYETKVSLVAGVETVIRYDFGPTDELSSGDIISFEKNPGSEVSLVAVSSPDSAQLTIDGLEKAFTPHKTSALTAGDHELKFTLQGYQDRVVKVKTHEGYKLTAVVKLAKSVSEIGEKDNTATAEAEISKNSTKEQVEILSTPTGFLRVRSEASTQAEEVGQVNPGEKYDLLSIDNKTGWYQIDLKNGKKGWISNQYAKKLTAGTISPTPTIASRSASLSPKPTFRP
jgi:hypothetical protein